MIVSGPRAGRCDICDELVKLSKRPLSGWIATWIYQYLVPAGTAWHVSIAVHHSRARQRPFTDVAIQGSGKHDRTGRGTTTMSTKGNLYASVTASARCRTRLIGRQP